MLFAIEATRRWAEHGITANALVALLVISEETVKTHVERVMGKLDLAGRAQEVVFAHGSGLVVARRPAGGQP